MIPWRPLTTDIRSKPLAASFRRDSPCQRELRRRLIQSVVTVKARFARGYRAQIMGAWASTARLMAALPLRPGDNGLQVVRSDSSNAAVQSSGMAPEWHRQRIPGGVQTGNTSWLATGGWGYSTQLLPGTKISPASVPTGPYGTGYRRSPDRQNKVVLGGHGQQTLAATRQALAVHRARQFWAGVAPDLQLVFSTIIIISCQALPIRGHHFPFTLSHHFLRPIHTTPP